VTPGTPPAEIESGAAKRRWRSGQTARELEAAAIALLAAIAIGSVLMLAAERSPGDVWWTLVVKVTTDPYWIGETLYRATALALTGLSVAIALDAGLFSIGGEGMLTAGVLACGVVGAALPDATPAVIAIPACVLAAGGAGAVVGGAIGALRAYRGAHEVITSIMMNFIVGGIVLWIGNAWLIVGVAARGPTIATGAELPQLPLAGSAANGALVIAMMAVAGVWWLRERTTWGQALRAVGEDPSAARAVGISVERVQVGAMVVAGALAGLAAANFVLGDKHAFEQELGRGTGILGISAALLGRSRPVGVALAALLLGALGAGGQAVGGKVPKELFEMLQGVVVLAVASASAWTRRREGAR
jgi:ABC-type uncharacterized transport system permease subunit